MTFFTITSITKSKQFDTIVEVFVLLTDAVLRAAAAASLHSSLFLHFVIHSRN
jgi:hypothetical protein